MPIPIETERLCLREFVMDDWPAMLAASGPETMAFFDEAPFAKESAKAWVQRAVAAQTISPRPWYALAVVPKACGDVIGFCDLVIRQPLECHMAYSGYRYASEYWNQGYGTEAERALLHYAFEELDLFRVSCICEPENVGSWRLMEKCGMRREGHGILDSWASSKGKRISTYFYAILRDEWLEQQRLGV